MNKKILGLTIVVLLIATGAFAQSASRVKPINVVWVADGDTLSIEQAQTRGTKVPGKLEIVVILNPKTISALNGQKFEFKWYKKGPTRYYLTNTFYEQVNASEPGHRAYTLNTGRTNLRTGWWKVQIEAYTDRKLLSFKNKREFWIQIKP